MLMVFERPPGQLTGKASDILAALKSANDWLNRTAIARALDQDKLVPYDVQLLEGLVTAGFAEKRKADKVGFIPFEWQYRATGKE